MAIQIKFFFAAGITLLVFLVNPAFGQSITGIVTDQQGEGLPFVSVYVKGTTKGTATNLNGEYELKLQQGKYLLVFHHVGYRQVEKEVEIARSNSQLDVTMAADAMELTEVVIRSDGEDPAYAVIRNAIEKRKYHLGEVESFNTQVYVKGLQRLDKAPERILGVNINIDTGIVYLSESISNLSFKQPDQYKEEVISSKVSGDPRAFTWNEAYRMSVSFYENLIEVDEISERGYVSPIANNALLFYDYKLEGTFFEDERLINKIKVIPKRDNDPVFQGYVYIVEDSWRLHSTDLMLTKEHQIEFVDSLRVQQVYAPLPEGPWMIISQVFDFKFKVFGFEGSGRYVAVYSDYKIDPAFDKKYFGNALIKVLPGSNERDSVYWASIRPMPLTDEEIDDYEIKDSIRIIKESKPYLDSVDQKNNKLTPGNVFISGYSYDNSYKKRELSINSALGMVRFNTVEGLVLNPVITYRKDYEDQRYWFLRPEFRYGFSSENFYGQLEAFLYFNRKNYGNARFRVGHFVSQLNEDDPIPPLVNTLETLLRENNFMKLFEKTYASYEQHIEIVNGIMFNGLVEYAERRQLMNSTDYRLVNREGVEYSSNIPFNEEIGDTEFGTHRAFFFDLDFRFRFAQRYADRPDRRYIYDSKYPTVFLNVKKAFDIFATDIDYTFLKAGVFDDFDIGLVGTTSWMVAGGGFVQKDSLTFIDFYHFNGNRSLYGNYNLGNFQLLDYYQFSTEEGFVQAHLQHNFNGFLFNKIPLVRKLKLQSVFTTNYAYTGALGNYIEFGYGIEHIFKILRVDYFMAIAEGRNVSNGFRFGIGF